MRPAASHGRFMDDSLFTRFTYFSFSPIDCKKTDELAGSAGGVDIIIKGRATMLDGQFENTNNSRMEFENFRVGERVGPASRQHPGGMANFVGIDIADAGNN